MITLACLFVTAVIAWAADDPFIWVLWVLFAVAAAFTSGEKS